LFRSVRNSSRPISWLLPYINMESVMECVSVPVSVRQADNPVRKETGIIFGNKIVENNCTPTKPQTFSEILNKFNQNNSSSSKKKKIYKKVRLSKTKSKADNSHSGSAKEQKNVQENKSTNNPVLNMFKSMQLKRKLEAEVCIIIVGKLADQLTHIYVVIWGEALVD
jgi:hypothetical protein